jgi:hypothetical protein
VETRAGYVIRAARISTLSSSQAGASYISGGHIEAPQAMPRRSSGFDDLECEITGARFFKSLGCENMFCFGEPSEVHHVEAALVVSFARDGIRFHRCLDRRKII